MRRRWRKRRRRRDWLSDRREAEGGGVDGAEVVGGGWTVGGVWEAQPLPTP